MLNNQKGYGNDDNSPLEFYGIWGRQYSDKAISVVLSEVIWIKQKRVKRVKPGWQFEPWLGSHMVGKGCCCARKHARYLIYNDNYMLFSVSLKLFWIMYYVSTWSHSQSCLMANSFLKGVQTCSYAFKFLCFDSKFSTFFWSKQWVPRFSKSDRSQVPWRRLKRSWNEQRRPWSACRYRSGGPGRAVCKKQTVPSGKHTKNYGKSPFLLGKLTISTGPFSIAILT